MSTDLRDWLPEVEVQATAAGVFGGARPAGSEAERAAPALKHPRPLELFEESCRAMGMGGDLALAKTVYLAATTRVLGPRKRLQAHTFILGAASSGKSYEMDAALLHLPNEAVVRFDGCSPRALIYDGRDIRNRVIVYSEMDSLPLGKGEDDAQNTALAYLRTLVVNGVASYDVVVKVKDGFSTQRYSKEGPAVLLVTGTKRIGDEQLASRLHEVELTVDRVRLRSVFAAQGRLFQGGKSGVASEAIVGQQAFLQSLAPLDVMVPFADALGSAILEKATLSDPRLTREFPRIVGFTAAHALLSIERRERDADGAVVATLEDYEAARGVIRELSTVREFPRFALEVWDVANAIFKETGRPVTVAETSKRMLKDHRHVGRTLNTLLQGGALQDVRERPSRTAPHLVVPSAESPCRILLPTIQDLERMSLPPEETPKRMQVVAIQTDTLSIQGERSDTLAIPMGRKDLSPLGHGTPGGIAPAGAPVQKTVQAILDSEVYPYQGIEYRVGDRLPDGRKLLSMEGGCPVLSRRPDAKSTSTALVAGKGSA